MHNIELIGFDLCPYVQRSVITLSEKDIPFKRTNIDLFDKPDWFLEISPLGKVPVLRINGEVLFESAVINEYLDEITPPSLHPDDAFLKAQNRAWIEYASDMSNISYRLLMAKDKESMNESLDLFIKQLAFLAKIIENEPFFNGQVFSLIDVAYAPLFIHIEYLLIPALNEDHLANYPKLSQWSNNILKRESVQNSIIDDFQDLAINHFQKNGSLLF